MIDPRAAAEWLGVHPETVRRWLRGGYLPGRLVGGRWRIDTGAVAALLEAGGNPPTTKAGGDRTGE